MVTKLHIEYVNIFIEIITKFVSKYVFLIVHIFSEVLVTTYSYDKY